MTHFVKPTLQGAKNVRHAKGITCACNRQKAMLKIAHGLPGRTLLKVRRHSTDECLPSLRLHSVTQLGIDAKRSIWLKLASL
jgi:hypothetical protein